MGIVQMSLEPSHPPCGPLAAGDTAVYKRTMLLLYVPSLLRISTKRYHAAGVFALDLGILFSLTLVCSGHVLGWRRLRRIRSSKDSLVI